jgi:two-component system, OmpR family, sensor histidine kinase KdpD
MRPSRRELRRIGVGATGIAVALTLASVGVALLERLVPIANASAVYLLAVIVLAVRLGAAYGVAGALGSFLAYDFLFVEPVHTFAVVDPGEWLNLLLLLVVGVVVGRLAGEQRLRADAAEIREREARSHYAVSRAIANADAAGPALGSIVELLRTEARMTRVWIGLLGGAPLERVVADTGVDASPEPAARHAVLRRPAKDGSPSWVSLHVRAAARRSASADLAVHRVPISADGRVIGSLWTLRSRSLGNPSDEETRLLSGAADQIGLALERDRLRGERTSLEVARAGDLMKSALVDAVSHDFRTPLATIRAAAGAMRDRTGGGHDGPSVRSDAEPPDRLAHDPAAIIDRQVAYLDRLVTNLLDLSRIEAGALRPALEPIALADAVADTLDRLALSVDRPIEIDVPPSLVSVLVDEVHLDAILTNLLENAVAHTAAGTPIGVRAAPNGGGVVRLTVEDGGPGVPDRDLGRIFEKFNRSLEPGRGSGIGLAVVRGLVEAGGGRVSARRSVLGGLAVDVDLPSASEVAGLATAHR